MHPKIQRTYEIRMLDDEAQCAEFSELCEELSREADPALLGQLFGVFTDETEHHEVMVDLQGLVEHYPSPEYVAALTAALPRMIVDARGWAKALLRALLQTPSDAELLRVERAKMTRADRDATAPVFREIAEQTPKVEAAALELASM